MRFLFALTLVGLILTTGTNARAMSQSLPKAIQDELVSRSVVHEAFTLIATDGAAIQLSTEQTQSRDGLKNLPPESGANRASCGNSIGDTNLIVALSEVTLRIVQTGSLSASDSKIIQSTPRCEPYLSLLGSIGNLLKPGSVAEQDLPERLSVIKTKSGLALQISMKSGRQALFRISDKIKGVESAKDLSRVRLEASTTGQNVGVSFSVERGEPSAPSHTRDRESCTFTETFERCERTREGKRECRMVTETRSGHRRTASDTTFTLYKIEIQLSALNGARLLTAQLSDGNFDTRTRTGECYADGGPR